MPTQWEHTMTKHQLIINRLLAAARWKKEKWKVKTHPGTKNRFPGLCRKA